MVSMTASSPRDPLATRLERAFNDHGYEQLSMVGLAKLCGFTRRALYHHFSSKEEAFRFALRWRGELNIVAGMAAGRRLIEEGKGAVDIITEMMDVRYGETRRQLGLSPHALELNDQAFRRARDIMVEAAVDYQAKLAGLLTEMEELGLLRFKPGTTPESLAQSLCDGARGTNQSLPPIPPDQLKTRYHKIITAILFGSAEPGKHQAQP
jgi:AcrR family transcriptional regulator